MNTPNTFDSITTVVAKLKACYHLSSTDIAVRINSPVQAIEALASDNRLNYVSPILNFKLQCLLAALEHGKSSLREIH